MKLAFFSPLPPAKSGIADYSAALLEEFRALTQVDTFTGKAEPFDASAYDAIIYQLGNNPYHADAYEMALRHPGIVVLHEANLHHLLADITIRRGDWDAYLREVEFDGGREALDYALKYVRTLKRGPDYDGVPMLRRILSTARGVIVHSDCVGDAVRAAGFTGRIGRIWHGAWIVEPERMGGRERLGLDELTPLIGIFGFLKPYKRVAQSLRAFRRLVKVEPAAKMLLVGEPHPDLQLPAMLRSLGIESNVRVTGFTPIEDFNLFLGACDIVLNLRYPTVGESSGTLLRALGMGKAVVVSDIGSFREYPDDICLKAPVGAGEEEAIFEYLNFLVSRPAAAKALGQRAREWVARECNWRLVAEHYLDFCAGREPMPVHPVQPAEEPQLFAEEIRSWIVPEARSYAETHITRLEKTLQITPPGSETKSVLEMGVYHQITPALKTRLGYGYVRGCYYGSAGQVVRRGVTSSAGAEFACDVDLFNAEKDPFPYADESYDTILCCELLEHLFEDPMHMMSEIHRVLKPGGHLVLTTPNIVSIKSIAAALHGYQPGLFPSYIKPKADGEVDARHNREYTPREITLLLANCGLEVELLETGPFLEAPHPELGWVGHMLERYYLTTEHRGEGIYAVGRKTGPIRERYPSWLYA